MPAKNSLALERAKAPVQATSRMERQFGIEYEAELFDSADKDEGIGAFLENREPE